MRRGARHEPEDLVGIELGHEDHRRARQQDRFVATNSPCVWKIGSACSSTSFAVKRQQSSAVRARSRRGCRASASRPLSGRSCRRCRGSRRDRRPRAARPRTRWTATWPDRAACRRRSCAECLHGRRRRACWRRGRGRLAFRGRADDDARLGVADEVFELGERVAGVERQVDARRRAGRRDRA